MVSLTKVSFFKVSFSEISSFKVGLFKVSFYKVSSHKVSSFKVSFFKVNSFKINHAIIPFLYHEVFVWLINCGLRENLLLWSLNTDFVLQWISKIFWISCSCYFVESL